MRRPSLSRQGSPRRGPDGVEQRQHVVGSDPDAMTGAGDESQLYPCCLFTDREELLVSIVVDQHLGEQRCSRIGETGAAGRQAAALRFASRSSR